LNIAEDNSVRAFREKVATDGALINAGYMVLNPEIFDYLEGDDTILEAEPLSRLAEQGELMSYSHTGFWQCMDTLREHTVLEELWASGRAPWKKWEE
ncbi:MAG: glucose-1-phosphate cytidylyltransferase, partial [Lachnospiraceae bacterium]|nr:glucose-1-phosphate cytidylyltransferase [Lachnospiraceae bacterium]